MHDLDNLGRALELKDLGGMIKVEQTQWTHQAMRAIGSGFQSVLFADVRTVADARACVAAVRAETPGSGGRLGVGMRRDVGTVRDGGSPAYVAALDELVIAVMVEKRECVEDLDAILSVKGIDIVQFGGSDYAMSIGVTGQRSHPDVVKAERKTIETALKKGLHPRVELGDITQAAPYLKWALNIFASVGMSVFCTTGGAPTARACAPCWAMQRRPRRVPRSRSSARTEARPGKRPNPPELPGAA
jgi:2-keto-3-deoxy-L-rhamnonate aldolase RhmA